MPHRQTFGNPFLDEALSRARIWLRHQRLAGKDTHPHFIPEFIKRKRKPRR